MAGAMPENMPQDLKACLIVEGEPRFAIDLGHQSGSILA
jgi:hypothetical protein